MKKIVALCICIMMVAITVQVFAADTVFINDDFENSQTTNWTDNTGRGVKTIETDSMSGNKYIAFNTNSTQYYNFQGKNIYSTGILYSEFDIIFSSGNMELQLRESRDVSAGGFTMAGRIRKVSNCLQYCTDGGFQYFFDSNGQWLRLNDTTKWYSIKMSMDIEHQKYSIYLFDKTTDALISSVENVNFVGTCQYINYFAFSSTEQICIDNVDIREIDISFIKITGPIYPKIPQNGSNDYSYTARIVTNSASIIPLNDVFWAIKTPKNGVSINNDTGVMTVTNQAIPGPVIIEAVNKYQPSIKTTFLIDIER